MTTETSFQLGRRTVSMQVDHVDEPPNRWTIVLLSIDGKRVEQIDIPRHIHDMTELHAEITDHIVGQYVEKVNL